MAAFPHLMSEGRIGSLALRNRILMCPMGDSLCDTDGSISENQAAYFEARAAGGAALLLVGSVSIAYPRASFDERQVAGSDDRYLPGLMDLTERVHRHGGRIAAQLVHNGQMSLLDTANGLPMLVPSVPKQPNPDRWSMMVTADEAGGHDVAVHPTHVEARVPGDGRGRHRHRDRAVRRLRASGACGPASTASRSTPATDTWWMSSSRPP